MSEARMDIVEWIEQHLAQPQLIPEVLESFADLTTEAAYRVQMAVKRRQAEAGDRIIGYKAALTSKAMQKQSGIGEPILGTLLASRRYEEGSPVSTGGFIHTTLEPEVAVVMGAALAGPGLTPEMARAAIAGYLPCVEIGDIRTGDNRRSLQQTIVCNTFNGGHVFGGSMCGPNGLDLRLEGMVLRVNGEIVSTATAATVLDDPINSVVFMANKLGELGLKLEPGMVLMTGSIVASVVIQPGDAVEVAFTRLGSVRARFTD